MSKETPKAGDLFLYDFNGAFRGRERYGIYIVMPKRENTDKLEIRWLCNSEKNKQYFHPVTMAGGNSKLEIALDRCEFLFNINGYDLETSILKAIGKL